MTISKSKSKARFDTLRRTGIYADDWSDEDGDRSISFSRDSQRLYVKVYAQGRGTQEIHLPIADVPDLIQALQSAIDRSPNISPQRNALDHT